MFDHRKTIRGDLLAVLAGRLEDGSQDWDRLISAAEREGVTSLVRQSLEDSGGLERIPEEARRTFQRARFATSARNLLILNQLCRVMEALGEIKPIVLKGADLAMTLYPSIALRPMCDLDLLVGRENLDEAVRRVGELGYRRISPEMASGHGRLTGHAVCLLGGPHDSVAVEVHWGLVAGDNDWRSPELDWFWEQTEEWKQDSQPVEVSEQPGDHRFKLPGAFLHLKPEAHLLYLAAHLMFQHSSSEPRLIWLYDLHLLVSRFGSRINWEEILVRAREFRWAAPLLASLKETKACFPTPLPDRFLEKLAEGVDHREQKLLQHLSLPARRRGESGWDEITCLSWPARLRFAWNHFFPNPAYVRWRYNPKPKWLWPFCYPYRWGVIFAEGLLALRRWVGRLAFRVSEENP